MIDDAGRRESEEAFIQEMILNLGAEVPAPGLTPARLFRAAVHDRPWSHGARDLFEILGSPSRRPSESPRAGDWMVRAATGTGDVGHVAILTSDRLLTPSALETEDIDSECSRPGHYGLVIEAGGAPRSRARPFARRLLDGRGRVPPDTVILRPRLRPDDEPDIESTGAAARTLGVRVVDEHGQPLVDGEYVIHQGGRREAGKFAPAGGGLVNSKSIDASQPFFFEVRDRACAIRGGACFDPDDPALEYGGTWFDWTLVRDDRNAERDFWPHYLEEMKADGGRNGVDRFWQHEHIIRRPIRLAGEAARRARVVEICAVPVRIRTGPIVRYTDHQRASIWLETSTPSLVRLRAKRSGGEAAVRSAHASTVRVGGRYFAIVEIDGLDPDTFYQYTLDLAPLPALGDVPVDSADIAGVFPDITAGVRLDVERQLARASIEHIAWLSFRTLRARYDHALRFATGSCRWYPGDVIGGDARHPGKSWNPDMLDELGKTLRKTPRSEWPHFQFYGGDQIYADEIGDRHHEELIRARFASRVPGPPDPAATVAARLVDGAWAGRFAHRLDLVKPVSPRLRADVEAGIDRIEQIFALAPELKSFANGRVGERQFVERYQTLYTRRHDVQKASQEAPDEHKARVAVELLPKLKALLATAAPFRVYAPYWARARAPGARDARAYRFRSCNFLLWKLPNDERDLPTLQDQSRQDVGVRGAEGRAHASADGGRHVADFAEYAYLYERAWTTSDDVRALLGNVPTFLMFDDHEVTDDWNFDVAWVRMLHSRRDHYRMWPKTITDALCAYWMYQGLGNKSRSQWRGDPRAEALERAQRAGIDALPELRRCIYRAVMAEVPRSDTDAFQTGLALDWHYQLPFEPPFLVPDCRTRKRLVPGDDAMRVIDHERTPPQSETIDQKQIDWMRAALDRCRHPVAFVAPSTPLLLQKKLMEFMTKPEVAARAWAGEVDVASGLAVFLGSTKLGIASAALLRLFRREKDLEHMVRDRSWRDLWGLVDRLRRNRSPLKTLVLVSGDVHHSYCMTGNLSGQGRSFPEILQITSSGLQTTIRGGGKEAVAGWQSSFSSDFGGRHIVPGYLSRSNSRQKEVALYENAFAMVDVRLGAEVEVRVLHQAGRDEYLYRYTSGPNYLKAGEPQITPWRSESVDAMPDDAAPDCRCRREVAVETETETETEDEVFEDFDQFEEDDPPVRTAPTVAAKPAPATIGFEFDCNIGVDRDVFAARIADMSAGATMPKEHDKVTDHRDDDGAGKLVDGFEVKVDGTRIEIATLPIKVDDDPTFDAVLKNVLAFAGELAAARARANPDTAISVAGVAGHPVRFTHPRTVVSRLPLVIAKRGSVGAMKWHADKGVWAAPQATITILLEHVGELIDAIDKSAGESLGKALTGSPSARLGVRSDIVVTAKRRVLADRRRRIGTVLSDRTKVTAADYSNRLTGLLMLMTSYLLCGEIIDRRDYEQFAKGYLPINVKAPFRDLFQDALTPRERQVFTELYFSDRANFFGLARDGATTGDESKVLFPPNSHAHTDQFHNTALTWGMLLDHTVNDVPLKVTKVNRVRKKKHAVGDEVLWAPLSTIIPFSATTPRVALELRRIGFAAHPAGTWEALMKTIRKLVRSFP